MSPVQGQFNLSVSIAPDGVVTLSATNEQGQPLDAGELEAVVKSAYRQITPYDFYASYWRIGETPSPHSIDVFDKEGQEVGYFSMQYLYLAKGWYRNGYKVGVTNDPYRRSGEIKASMEHTIPCPMVNVRHYEKLLHRLLREKGKHIELEWFALSDIDVEYFKSIQTVRDLMGEIRRINDLEAAAQKAVFNVNLAGLFELVSGQKKQHEFIAPERIPFPPPLEFSDDL